MNEQQREEFLENFKANPTNTTLGFCVMGGIFGEGIDLKDRDEAEELTQMIFIKLWEKKEAFASVNNMYGRYA
jgi:Rad3-related DNA helicase